MKLTTFFVFTQNVEKGNIFLRENPVFSPKIQTLSIVLCRCADVVSSFNHRELMCVSNRGVSLMDLKAQFSLLPNAYVVRGKVMFIPWNVCLSTLGELEYPIHSRLGGGGTPTFLMEGTPILGQDRSVPLSGTA